MKFTFLNLSILIISFILAYCNSHIAENKKECDYDLLSVLKDSLFVSADIHEFKIKGEIESEYLSLKYYSISKNDFYDAIKNNEGHVRYFDRNMKINESKLMERNDSVLKVGNNKKYIYLIDIQANKFSRARNFFFEGKVGDLFVIKRTQFEDKETIIVNSNTLQEELYLYGLSASVNPQDSLIFYCNTFRVTPDDNHEVFLFKVKNNKIDTLLASKTEWFTEFSFFDPKEQSIYYIHSHFDNYDLKSTFARMDLYFK